MPDLDIVIVTWNSRQHIGRCLRSIAACPPSSSHRVTVVDNASTDGTADLVSREFPGVRMIRNAANTGFASANNQVLRTSDAPYWLLFNPDAELTPGAADRLLEFMERTPKAWAAGPLLTHADGTPQHPGRMFPSLRNMVWESLFLDRLFPHSSIFGAHRGRRRVPEGPERVDFVHGAAALVRSSAAERVGLLDEGFFVYFEEVDWCARMSAKGGECWIVPEARVVHHGGIDPGHYDERRLLYFHRSLLRYFDRHAGPAARAALRPLVLMRSLIRMTVWSLAGLFRPGLRPTAGSSLKGYAGAIRLVLGGG